MTTSQGGRLLALAAAWHRQGKVDAAVSGLERVLNEEPSNVLAHVRLGYLFLEQDDLSAALTHLSAALALKPDAKTIRDDVAFLTRLQSGAYAVHPTPEIPSNPLGKIRFRAPAGNHNHRSGWRYALHALQPLHNSEGVLFDGFLEDLFAWQHRRSDLRPADQLLALHRQGSFEYEATAAEKGLLPLREPWVGFFHNPSDMPAWFHPAEAPQTILAKTVWRESALHCRGLFTLSEAHADWLRAAVGLPVSALVLPTETPTLCFDMDRFLDNPRKKIIQVGWWLRRQNAIYALPMPADNALGYEKVRLVPRFFDDAERYLSELLRREREIEGDDADPANTAVVQHVSNDEFDRLLAENIVFIQLYDAAANNTVVECIARATPLLVNPLSAVVEYLGPGYPLYYDDLADAARKALDPARLRAAHDYLLTCPTRRRLSAEEFRRSFVESEVYQRLETP